MYGTKIRKLVLVTVANIRNLNYILAIIRRRGEIRASDETRLRPCKKLVELRC